MIVPTQSYSVKLVGTGASCLLLGPFAPDFSKLFGA